MSTLNIIKGGELNFKIEKSKGVKIRLFPPVNWETISWR